MCSNRWDSNSLGISLDSRTLKEQKKRNVDIIYEKVPKKICRGI